MHVAKEQATTLAHIVPGSEVRKVRTSLVGAMISTLFFGKENREWERDEQISWDGAVYSTLLQILVFGVMNEYFTLDTLCNAGLDSMVLC